jgi:hypothetical protein
VAACLAQRMALPSDIVAEGVNVDMLVPARLQSGVPVSDYLV